MTIDATDCQIEVAEQIIGAGADSCPAVKGNQPTLHRGIVAFFAAH